MPRPLPRDRWLAEAAERFAALDAWRQAHPRATWTEIETALEEQLGPLRAQVLGETAMASDATDGHGASAICPQCGGRVVAAGVHPRSLRGEGEQPIALERTYTRCPDCQTGVFPPR